MQTIFFSYGSEPKVVLTGLKDPVTVNDTPAFEGYVMYKGHDIPWSAYPLADGYLVHYYGPQIRRPRYQGATFNLGLEVATGIKGAL